MPINDSETTPLLGDDGRSGRGPMPSQLKPGYTHPHWLKSPIWVPDPRDDSKRPRTVILCFDGTGNQFKFGNDNSNVVQFFSALKKDNNEQLVYYQTGIGTYSKTFITPLLNQFSSVLDEMFALNLSTHVMDGYEFLMQNYKAGDKISIFGFSRGAYTARALAGMVQKVGLLPDTVASVGIVNKELPFVANNSAIRGFRHAIALDEHRAKFMPNFYHRAESYALVHSIKSSTQTDPVSHSHEASSSTLVDNNSDRSTTEMDIDEVWFAGCHCDVGGGSVANGARHSLARIPLRWMVRECFRMKTGIIFDRAVLKSFGLDPDGLYPNVKPRGKRKSPPIGVQFKEPEDIGSGLTTVIKFITQLIWLPFHLILIYLLAPIVHFVLLLRCTTPMRWLFRKLNIAASPEYVPPLQQIVISTPVVNAGYDEEEEELNDALSPEYDQLAQRWFWWMIEFIPMRLRDQQGSRSDFFVTANRGRGRKIYGDAKQGNLRIHRSVKTRLKVLRNGKPVYKPRAWWTRRTSSGGPKVKEPAKWDIENPDPKTQWTWVD